MSDQLSRRSFAKSIVASAAVVAWAVFAFAGEPGRSAEVSGEQAAVHRQLCLSHEAGRPLCDELGVYDAVRKKRAGVTLVRHCVYMYHQDMMMEGAVSGAPKGAVIGECLKLISAIAQDDIKAVDLKAAKPFCRIWLDNWDQPKAACEKMFSEGVLIQPGPAWRKKCAKLLGIISGDARSCGDLAGGKKLDLMTDFQSCMDYASFHRARVANDPGLCGSSAFCRRYMGLAVDCGPQTATGAILDP